MLAITFSNILLSSSLPVLHYNLKGEKYSADFKLRHKCTLIVSSGNRTTMEGLHSTLTGLGLHIAMWIIYGEVTKDLLGLLDRDRWFAVASMKNGKNPHQFFTTLHFPGKMGLQREITGKGKLMKMRAKEREVRLPGLLRGRLLRVGYNFAGFEFDTINGRLAKGTCEGDILATFLAKYNLSYELNDAHMIWGDYNVTSDTWSGVIGKVRKLFI